MSKQASNALIADLDTPYGTIPFEQLETKDYLDAWLYWQEIQNKALQAIVENEEVPTFENTARPYFLSEEKLYTIHRAFYIYEGSGWINNDGAKELQTAFTRAKETHFQNVYTFPGLYERLQSVYNDIKDDENVPLEHRRLLKKELKDFYDNGAELQGKDLENFQAMSLEIEALIKEMEHNHKESLANFRLAVDIDEFQGIGKSLLKRWEKESKEEGAEEGKILLKLSGGMPGSIVPIVVFANGSIEPKIAWQEHNGMTIVPLPLEFYIYEKKRQSYCVIRLICICD